MIGRKKEISKIKEILSEFISDGGIEIRNP